MDKPVSGVVPMEFVLILLGLFPVMFLFDHFSDSDGGSEDEADDTTMAANTGVDGDFFAGNDELGSPLSDMTGLGTGLDPLEPITDDDIPFEGSDIDPDDVLTPITDDDEPFEGAEIDPDEVLSPIIEPGDDYAGGGSDLQEMIAGETDFSAGVGMLGDRIGETGETALGPGDNIFAAEDDGAPGTGALTDWDGTPILSDDVPMAVIDGGAGNDEITLGDGAGYAFGGEGDDTLIAGAGKAALFGGVGDDVIEGDANGLGFWADAGKGHDTITGSAGDDTLYGGAHSAEGAGADDDDLIDGGMGDDVIAGGYGADTLIGGEGDDVINHLGRLEEDIHWERHDFAWHIDNDADVLEGGEGNDTLIMDRADTATGGTGADVFWVYFDGASGDGAAQITDFAIGEDFLRVTLNPLVDHGDMNLEVGPSDNGIDGVVRVNGETVAILQGTPGASAADVYVEVVDNIFVP
jgi:Ca2+-binding RTX toxin-like protein